jgi:hypothetical protein
VGKRCVSPQTKNKKQTKTKTKTKDPFSNVELNPAVPPTWAEIFDVDRMEAELVAMKAAGVANAYSELEKNKGPVVQRGFTVTTKMNMGTIAGNWRSTTD